MTDLIILIVSALLLLLIFTRRYYLLEKGHLFGKMVLKKAFHWPARLSKEDHEITAKEMMPDPSTIDPKLVVKGDSYFKKAELELKRNNLSDAEKLYIKAIAMNPSHVEAHAKLGMLYLNQEQFAKAELIYRKLVLTVTDDPVYYSNLGLSLFQQEKYAEAKEFYEKSIELDASRAGRFYSLARINHLLGDFENALFNIEKALTLDPDNLDYGLTLAHWYVEKGLHADAKKLLETIQHHWPDNAEAKELMREMEK
jgi:tetratricopeptide (TPR) repeat protein